MKKGFTLAEVLVTLGIIGVVSAMTLPTLTKNHQRQVYVTQLRKVYNELSQAFEQVINDNNAVSLWESNLMRDGIENFFRTYLKTTKICNASDAEECFANEYKNLNGTTIRTRNIIGTSNNDNSGSAILADGASVFIYRIGGVGYNITVDINGSQGPNILGRDLFDFIVSNDGTAGVGGSIEDMAHDFSTNCASATETSGYGSCFAKILNDGWKMDY